MSTPPDAAWLKVGELLGVLEATVHGLVPPLHVNVTALLGALLTSTLTEAVAGASDGPGCVATEPASWRTDSNH